MSDDTTAPSAAAQFALAMNRDFRSYPADFYTRVSVLGAPSPQDLVQLLDDAAGAQAGGMCQAPAAAARLLRQLGSQPWRASLGDKHGLRYEVQIAIGAGEGRVQVQRYPQPHIVSVA
jgi:hypothetical protein